MRTPMSHPFRLAVAALAAALLLPACSSYPTAGRLIFDFDAVLALDQVRLQVVRDGVTLAMADFPPRPAGPVAPGADVVVLFDDALAGGSVDVYAAGLTAGAQRGRGSVVLRLVRAATVVAHVTLEAAECAAGSHYCDGVCYRDDDASRCGLACQDCPLAPLHGRGSCTSGACVLECDAGYVICAGACVDLAADAAHCGACGRACASGQTCQEHSCRANPCAAGQHACGGTCVLDAHPAHCGTSCTPCPAPPHGHAVCDGSGCGVACDADYQPCGDSCCPLSSCGAGTHDCSGNCVSDHDVATCGGRCTGCPTPTHGAPTCDGVACGATCDLGYHPCGSQCRANGDPTACGSSCAPCPAPAANGHATCDGTSCGVVCDAGHHLCGGACVSNLDPATCGASCTSCWAPANGHATCNGTSCGTACNSGYKACGSGCIPTAQTCGGTTATWRLRSSSGPSARSLTSMAYDPNRGVTVLYGGWSPSADTWEWDGTSWAQRAPATVPPPRCCAAMAYDPASARVLMFGGEKDTSWTKIADTWAWNGTNWQNVANGTPSARSYSVAATTSILNTVVLYGGSLAGGDNEATDLYFWSGTGWTAQSLMNVPSPAPARFGMVFDSVHGELVLFGGSTNVWSGQLANTWVLPITMSWTQEGTAGPPPAAIAPAMAFHEGVGLAITFGGYPSYGNTTHAWNGTSWAALTTTGGPPPGRYGAGMAYDSARQVIVMFGGMTTSGYAQDTWELRWQ